MKMREMDHEKDEGESDKWVESEKPKPMGEDNRKMLDFSRFKNLSKRTKIFLVVCAVIIAVVIIIAIVLTQTAQTESEEDQFLGNHEVIRRNKWNGLPPKSSKKMMTPVPLVVIKQVPPVAFFNFEHCAKAVRVLQVATLNKNNSDIHFSFLLCGDGNIYVGRGWDIQPEQGDGMIDIAFIGDYNFETPDSKMIDAAKLLLEYGVMKSKLAGDYKLKSYIGAQNQPGYKLVDEVKTWPHYVPTL